MKDPSPGNSIGVDYLMEAIKRKLEANRSTLERSINHGRLSWRFNKKKGEIEVDLELKI